MLQIRCDMKLRKQLLVTPGRAMTFDKFDPDHTYGWEKSEVAKRLEANTARLDELQLRLFAESRHAVLIILQGMDASGKDGTVRHVMSGLNPASCRVTSFKVPSAEEARHDFLWRVHHVVPARGEIGIFNRSHYEDVLVVRVRELVPKEVWKRRYDQINDFEQMLTESGVTILKFFLHIDKAEQRDRLKARLVDPAKNWKFDRSDLDVRRQWNLYQRAYEDALSQCSTKHAPWFVIPANKKWFRNLAVSDIIRDTLEKLHPQFPKPLFDPSKIRVA